MRSRRPVPLPHGAYPRPTLACLPAAACPAAPILCFPNKFEAVIAAAQCAVWEAGRATQSPVEANIGPTVRCQPPQGRDAPTATDRAHRALGAGGEADHHWSRLTCAGLWSQSFIGWSGRVRNCRNGCAWNEICSSTIRFAMVALEKTKVHLLLTRPPSSHNRRLQPAGGHHHPPTQMSPHQHRRVAVVALALLVLCGAPHGASAQRRTSSKRKPAQGNHFER